MVRTATEIKKEIAEIELKFTSGVIDEEVYVDNIMCLTEALAQANEAEDADIEDVQAARLAVNEVKNRVSQLMSMHKDAFISDELYYSEYSELMDELYWAEDALALALLPDDLREAELQRRRDTLQDKHANIEIDLGDMPF